MLAVPLFAVKRTCCQKKANILIIYCSLYLVQINMIKCSLHIYIKFISNLLIYKLYEIYKQLIKLTGSFVWGRCQVKRRETQGSVDSNHDNPVSDKYQAPSN